MEGIPQETEVKRKRGRPKGSKNKPKPVANDVNCNAIDPVLVVDQDVSAENAKKPAKKRAKKAATGSAADVEPAPLKKEAKAKATSKAKAIAPKLFIDNLVSLAGGPDPDLLAKMDRVMRQRMFLLNQSDVSDIHRTYGVIGSTGNVYTVDIKETPRCNCPDWIFHRNTCKHVLFIVLKVLKVSLQDPISWQRSYSSMDLKRIFANAPQTPVDRVTQQLQEQFQQLNKAILSLEPDLEAKTKAEDDSSRRPIEGDCPICFDEMTTRQPTVWCKAGCHNNLHKVCFDKWSGANHGATTCVYCRAEWVSDGSKEPKPKPKKAKKKGFRIDPTKGDKGYQNLGHLVGAPTTRD